jgi:uncharacterized protein YoxC
MLPTIQPESYNVTVMILVVLLPVIAIVVSGVVFVRRLLSAIKVEEKVLEHKQAEILRIKYKTRMLLSSVPSLASDVPHLTDKEDYFAYKYLNKVYMQRVDSLF